MQKQKNKSNKLTQATFITTKSGKQIAIAADEEKSYEIINKNHTALHKDKILILPITKSKKLQDIAKLVKVVERARNKIAGFVSEELNGNFFIPNDPNIQEKFQIESSTQKLDKNKLYVAELKYYDNYISAIVTKTLGDKKNHDAIQEAILINHGFNKDFPLKVKKEALKIKKSWDEGKFAEDEKNRLNFQDRLTFTIDPDDAKDFDDAISVTNIKDNRYEIGIHIADVSFFVKPNSAIDKEAQKRATSVYLVDRTIHMLPEELSADVCSLVPNKKRFAYSVIFDVKIFDKSLEILDFEITPTIIKSDYRLSYKQAQNIIDNKEKADDDLKNALIIIDKIRQILQEKRRRSGALEFSTKELKFILDDNKKPIDVQVKQIYNTNNAIEELMLLANKTVASWFSKHAPYKFFVYRVHDEPNHEKIQELNTYLNALGFGVNKKIKFFTRKHLQTMINQVKNSSIEDLVNKNIVRSLAKAEYTFKNIGHFSLGFAYYTHFTSPIRRYPDIMVHRLLKAHKNDVKLPKEELNIYKKMTRISTEKEIEAMQAERDSIKEKQIEYMQDKIGEVFSGTVSGVIKNGFFVVEDKTLTEGFVPASSLKDWFVFDEKKFELKSKQGQSFKIGNKVKIKLLSIDKELKTITWKFVEKSS